MNKPSDTLVMSARKPNSIITAGQLLAILAGRPRSEQAVASDLRTIQQLAGLMPMFLLCVFVVMSANPLHKWQRPTTSFITLSCNINGTERLAKEGIFIK